MFSHDQAFKNLAIDYKANVIQFCAPEEWARLPPGVIIEDVRQEMPKEKLEASHNELDVPLIARFPDGDAEAIIFVIENESTNRADFLHYLATVCLRISMLRKTRRVVPVAVHPFRKTPLECNLTLGGNTRNYLEFSCISCVFGTMNALDFAKSDNIVARLCMPLMKHDAKDHKRVLLNSFEGLVQLEDRSMERRKYFDFISHYGKLDKRAKEEFFGTYINTSPFKGEIMTLYDVLLEEGIEKGIEKGRAASVLELYEKGIIDERQARASLEMFAKCSEVPQELIAEALAKIGASPRAERRPKK